MADRANDELFLTALRARLTEAESEHKRIQSVVGDIVRNAPTGIPLPDGKYQCVRTAREADAAFREYEQAFREFRDYVNHGIVW